MRPITVTLGHSESPDFHHGQVMPFDKFEVRARRVAFGHKTGGYLKTHITVTFDNGHTHSLRLDLAEHQDRGYRHHIETCIAFAESTRGQQKLATIAPAYRDDWLAKVDVWRSIDWTPRGYVEELTPHGLQLVMPGCEKVAPDWPDKPLQLGLFN